MDTAEKECFIQFFEQQVLRTPDACAVYCADEALSYHKLNRQANVVAEHLRKEGVGPDVIVGLLAERSLAFLITILGIFKAGGAYLPLDPHAPAEHLVRVFVQSEIRLILVQQLSLTLLEQAIVQLPAESQPHMLHLDLLLTGNEREDNPAHLCQLSNLAYVIFTSGSTGNPKGVMIEQRSMLNHLRAKIEDIQLCSADSVAQNASQCFDISLWEFLAVLLVGGSIHIIQDDLARHPMHLLNYVIETGITIWEIVPSFLHAMLRSLESSKAPPSLTHVRWLISTGEALPMRLCRQWFSYYPLVPIMNAYGPTECSDRVTHYPIYGPPADEADSVSIGHTPIKNVRLYVLDANLQHLPVGRAGELYVGGIGPGRGYLRDPRATAVAFLPDPFGGESGARLYRTGDLVRYWPDGHLEYIRRIDQQVKIRGFRIEPGEIEVMLRKHPAVQQAVVLVQENAHHEKYLVASIVPQVGSVVTSHELELYLQTKLSRYMIPGAFVLLDMLPLTRNGKIDRKALHALTSEQSENREIVLAVTPLEQTLTEIWVTILGKKTIGRRDDFLALGGHSLLIIELIAQIEEQLGVRLQFQECFEHRTIAELATLIQSRNVSALVNDKKKNQPSTFPDDAYPITYFQRKYVQAFQQNPQSYPGMLIESYLITGTFDPHRFRTALERLVAAHTILHSHIVSTDEGFYQKPIDKYKIRINEYIYETGETLQQAIKDIVQRERTQPFHLYHDIPIRATILQSHEQVSGIVLSIHHIVIDEHALIMLRKQLFDFYEEPECSPQKSGESSFAEYAWNQHQLTRQEGSVAYLFWLEQVRLAQKMGTNLVSSWHADTAEEQRLEIDVQQGQALYTVCQMQQITPCMCFLAIFALFLRDIFASQCVAIGLTMSMRHTRQSHNVMGPLVNHGIFCLDLAAMPRLLEVYTRIKDLTFSYYTHIDFPVEYFRENPQVVDGNPSPSLFNFLLNYYAEEEAVIASRPNFTVEPLFLTQGEKTIMRCFTLNIYERRNRMFTCEIRYRKALFDQQSALALSERFRAVIQHVLDHSSS